MRGSVSFPENARVREGCGQNAAPRGTLRQAVSTLRYLVDYRHITRTHDAICSSSSSMVGVAEELLLAGMLPSARLAGTSSDSMATASCGVGCQRVVRVDNRFAT
jgi:hypothetical protein